ncbi:hypothetical protein [Sulfitobacter geojensis]|jgi:hypothetical protein|uniref:YMGG-like Gly-zipper domain-containing protein n=1 Tax=Sulfitobacter geojensis TaxID=1342299 RepID=A0AAE3B573_9RHOB|nr:hypothetical protein [Sulfitobacter geojensis]KHA53029.1 hypothetical protein Z947_3340 [Sulfitobacter geojensis]MBM1687650.1 hypothetical protein [Sulfitobacter geojensis]MBM1691717.1 hypothetical protein [Sulfitobacter geojensis]MBM1703883.1 hypothetical protein [Sulfitobacter geojensis]MBM1707941.1 hypothetical protein [Sulfitobacter geojensis]
MSIKPVLLASALCASLAACGDTVVEQGLVGTAVGAGAAAVTSGSLLQGAAIGAAGNIAFCQLNPGKCRSVN